MAPTKAPKARAVQSQRRVEYAQGAAAAVREAEGRLREIEAELHAHARLVATANEEWLKLPLPRPEFMFYPTPAAARERATAGNGLQSARAAELDRLAMLRQRLADAERVAAPLSPAAADRLRQLVLEVSADDELRERGIDPGYARSAAGREHLTAIAREYDLEVAR
jgi:hypothetical protein